MVNSFNFKNINIGELMSTDLIRYQSISRQKTTGNERHGGASEQGHGGASSPQVMKDMEELLERHPRSMFWMTNTLSSHILKDMESMYLIYMNPSLNSVMKAQFLRENCRHLMEAFHSRFPISFVLDLSVPSDRVLQAKGYNYKSRLMTTREKRDEADASKLRQRVILYDKAKKNLSKYFKAKELA